MKHRSSQSGHTFIELILVIVLLAIALPALLHLFAEVTVSGAQSHALPTVTSLASELMEEIRSRKFDELGGNADGNGNWSGTLGPDGGEVAKDDFNDVDDFNGWAQDFSPDFADYTATVTVSYVNAADLGTPLVVPETLPNDWTPSYKRIEISVSNASLAGPVTVVTVVSEIQNL